MAGVMSLEMGKKHESGGLVGLGSRLLIIRSGLGLTQRDFAQTMNLSLRAYQSYEYGHRGIPPESLMALGNRHDVDLNWLILGRSRAPMTPDIALEFEAFARSVDDYLRSNRITLLPAQRGAIASKWINDRINKISTSSDDVITWIELMGARQ